MSRADPAVARERLLAAATSLGVAQGVGALSIQAIATAGGVSKALVLYHFGDKAAVLNTLAQRLSDHTVAELESAATADDTIDAWRTVARSNAGRGERALLAALLREEAVRENAAAMMVARERAATTLGVAVLAALDLTPKISTALLGRVILRQIDGLAVSTAEASDTALDGELDGFALALLALGR